MGSAIHTALLQRDLVGHAAAEGWYTKLIGRVPDHPPMATLVQWELAAERRRLPGQGIVLGDDFEGDYSTLAQVRDPDGNLITLATQPS